MIKSAISTLFLGAFILFAIPVHAQFTTVSATVTDPNGIPYAGGTMSAVLVPGSSGGYTLNGAPYSGRVGPATLDSTGKFTANFGDVTLISPGSPQWQITIDSNPGGILPPMGTGSQTFTFTSTGTTISGSSPVSLTTALNALVPKLTNFVTSGGIIVAPYLEIDAAAPPYNVVGDGRYSTAATMTNGSNAVTCPLVDCNFVSTDIGKKCSGFTNNGFGTLVLPAGCAITTINSTTNVTVSVTANVNASGSNNGTFYYGTDQTSGTTAAFAAEHALPRCGTIRFPNGYITLAGNGTTSVYGTQPATCAPNGSNIDNTGEDIGGQGKDTTNFVLLPGYGNVSFIYQNNQGPIHLHDIHMNCMGWSAYTPTTPTTSMIYIGSDSTVANLKFSGCGQSQNSTSLLMGGSSGFCSWINVYEEASAPLEIDSRCDIYGVFYDTQLTIGSSAVVNDFGGQQGQGKTGYNGLIANSGIYNCWGGVLGGGNSTVTIRLGVNSSTHLNSCTVGSIIGGQYGILWSGAGATVYASNNTVIQGGTNGALNNTGNNTSALFVDDGTTTFGGSIANFLGFSNSVYNALKNVHGACTGVGTAAQTLGLYGTGPNVTASTCTSTTIGTGNVASAPGTMTALLATATAAGTNASSGVVTVLKNGAGTALTCTIGTGTRCNDSTHTVNYVAGDLISLQFTTQTADTLAGIKAQAWPLF